MKQMPLSYYLAFSITVLCCAFTWILVFQQSKVNTELGYMFSLEIDTPALL